MTLSLAIPGRREENSFQNKAHPITGKRAAGAKRPALHSIRPILNAALRAEGTIWVPSQFVSYDGVP